MLARRRDAAPILAPLISLAFLLAPTPGVASAGTVSGTVPMRGMNVVLLAARGGAARPVVLGSDRSGRGGRFTIRYRRNPGGTVKYLLATRPGGSAEAGFPVPASAYRLAAALGGGSIPGRADLDERTTVAMAFAMAQFLQGGRVAGAEPGLRNSAAMTRNLAARRGGRLSPVLQRFPNGRSTSTLATFNSLANLLAACRNQGQRCKQLLLFGSKPGTRYAADTLAATANIAKYPWYKSRALYRLSRLVPRLYAPALGRGERPDAWTLALRFEGDGESLDGPGAIAIDAKGSLWVGNNYEYSRKVKQAACGGRKLLRFTPTGHNYPGSPYQGGGVIGAGFGIGIDPDEHVWVGNFGFAGRGCNEEPPPGKSVSEFLPSGKAVSPPLREVPKGSEKFKGGWEQGEIFWPQATVSDQKGNIWIANCGNESVTKYPEGDPFRAVNIPSSATLLGRPFGIAINAREQVFVTGNESHSVAVLEPDGNPARPPITGGGIHRPLGIAGDSRGYMWVSNSTWVIAPCSGRRRPQGGPAAGGTVTLLQPSGKPARRKPFNNGGLRNPWGIAVDGDDTVWVANFGGKRVAHLCGVRTKLCPTGRRRVGAPISPARTGYGFDGLRRVTGLSIDPSGNVWLVNNWRTVPIQTNPGGYQIVAYLGVAAPVHTPLIGPPERP